MIRKHLHTKEKIHLPIIFIIMVLPKPFGDRICFHFNCSIPSMVYIVYIGFIYIYIFKKKKDYWVFKMTRVLYLFSGSKLEKIGGFKLEE